MGSTVARTEEMVMPGIRDANLRSGDFNEEVGVLILRTVSAVAPVPRPEDVGIDVISTILEPEPANPRRLIARDTFAVSLKSASITELDLWEEKKNASGNPAYSLDDLGWLRGAQLPLFFGRVKAKPAPVLELYTTSELESVMYFKRDRVRLRFEQRPKDEKASQVDGVWHVYLGEPILRLTLDVEANRAVIPVLRKWCEFERENTRLRPLSHARFFKWETNGMPIDRGELSSSGAEAEALRQLRAPAEAILSDAVVNEDREQYEVASSVLTLLRRRGIGHGVVHTFEEQLEIKKRLLKGGGSGGAEP